MEPWYEVSFVFCSQRVFEIGTEQYNTVDIDQRGLGAQQPCISKYAIVSP
jgi:hypothetical protein